MITEILQYMLLVLILAAWRFGLLWFRPMRPHRRCEGKGCPKCRQSGMVRRLGGKKVAELRLNLHQSIAGRMGGS